MFFRLVVKGTPDEPGNTQGRSPKQTGKDTFKQTDEPWKGNPEKEQRSHVEKDDLERWHKTNTN